MLHYLCPFSLGVLINKVASLGSFASRMTYIINCMLDRFWGRYLVRSGKGDPMYYMELLYTQVERCQVEKRTSLYCTFLTKISLGVPGSQACIHRIKKPVTKSL
jgi:hypothetical protein